MGRKAAKKCTSSCQIMDGRQLKILTYPRRRILVEGTGTFEHRLHIRNAACIEVRDVTIKGIGSVEHTIHSRNTACVPVNKVLIKAIPRTTVRLHNGTSVMSAPQTRHVRHAARIPHANVSISRLRCRCVTAPQHQLCPQCLIRARDAICVE